MLFSYTDMLEHFKGDEAFVKKILDYIVQVEDHSRMILTPFYNPHQVSIIESLVGNKFSVHTEGGFIGSENKRVILCPDYIEVEPSDYEIVVVEVIYNRHFASLQHKDVLGALMHLGITRELIGDIYEENEHLYFATTEKNYDYIKNELKKIKKASVTLTPVTGHIEIKRSYTKRTFFVSSLRLDKVISAVYKLSRNEASEWIRGQKVKVNHACVTQVDYLVKDQDLLSLSKHGRVFIEITENTSRSGNIVINGYFYK